MAAVWEAHYYNLKNHYKNKSNKSTNKARARMPGRKTRRYYFM